jgi:hypothetical protein
VGRKADFPMSAPSLFLLRFGVASSVTFHSFLALSRF